jgi:4-hydroxybenzoate polyprenyltransferase
MGAVGQPVDVSVVATPSGAALRPRRSTARAVVVALRPRQWLKNVFVFAALMLTQQIGQSPQTRATVITFVLFCAVSSAVYLLNDVVDVESDRRHPVKRHRPIAAGDLQPRLALVLAFGLGVAGVVGGLAVNSLVAWIILGYVALQVAYTLALKQMVIVEALAIAGGFVLRVWAGGAAIDEPISPYLYLSMIFLALFQAFAKRRHELQVLADQAGNHRQSLTEYTINLLDQLIIITATSTIVTYSLYAITTPHRPQGITANMLLLTIPFVLYAIFRYLYLVQVQGVGGSPEDILFTDRLLLLDVIAWAVLLVVILYVLPQPIV